MTTKPGTVRARTRRERIRNGTWNPPVDINTVRAHIRALQDAGMTIPSICAAANVPPTTVNDIMYAPRRVCVHGDTAARLLTVTAQPSVRACLDHTDSTGTARRVQAMVANQHDYATIAARLGWHPANVARLAHQRRTMVTAATRDKVAALYQELSNTPGTSPRAAQVAQRNGWLPPDAWDDDAIDDPNTRPYQPAEDNDIDEVAVERALRGEAAIAARLRPAEKEYAAQVGLRRGMGCKPVARHLGMTPWAVTRIGRRMQSQGVSV